jgi:hypothetical protein
MVNVDIHAIVSTIENYENRTVTPISVSNNSVQSTVTNTVYCMLPHLSCLLMCHNDVINAGQNNRLFAVGTDMDRALLRLLHIQKGTHYVQICDKRVLRVPLQPNKGYSRVGYQQWENSLIPKILESKRCRCTLEDFFSAHMKSKQDYDLIH